MPLDTVLPLVSVILTTRDRPRLLSIALRCYQHQTYAQRELIVVDDGETFPADAEAVAAVGGRLLRAAPGTPLGLKLNQGVEAARGRLCQKMDDDDWYGPTFLETMVTSLLESSSVVCQPALTFLAGFLFFDLARWEVRESVPNNIPGATLLFAREDWRERRFRALSQDEDVWFLLDQVGAGLALLPVQEREIFLAVRHRGGARDRGHTWTVQWDGQQLEEYLLDRPLHPGGPEELLPDWAIAAYQDLRRDLLAQDELEAQPAVPEPSRSGVDR
jgi:glycosyltransferase involved in cell wall biosynthesis